MLRSTAVISLLFLISCPSAFAGGQHRFSIKVFTSPDDQFWTNSVIIEGEHEVMLVDAQLTKTNAERVLEEIKETKKPLSIVYITHEHADHFLGLEVFREAYPGVRIIANSAVTHRINKVYQEKVDKWKKISGSGATSHVVVIEKFDGNFIEFESSRIEVLKDVQGDTGENTMLWIPGHSKVGAPLDANTAVDFTENYLLVFEEEIKKAKDPDSLINTMKERFPSADFLLALDRGAMANVKSDKKDSYMTPANKPYACRFRTSRGKSARLV